MGPTRMVSPLYDSRVNLETSPPRSSRFPHPFPPPICLPIRLSSLIVSLSLLCRRTGPPRTDQSDLAMLRVVWLAQRSQPWLPSRPSLAAQYEGEAICWLTKNFTTSMSSTSRQPLTQLVNNHRASSIRERIQSLTQLPDDV